MEKKKIYNLVVVNEDMEIVDVSSYTDKEAAKNALNEDYKNTKKMLEAEGWEEDVLSVDDFTEGDSYWVQYGESSYYAEVKSGYLYE